MEELISYAFDALSGTGTAPLAPIPSKYQIRSQADALQELLHLKPRLDIFVPKLPRCLLISGSAALRSVLKEPVVSVNDIDMYINQTELGALTFPDVLELIDRAFREAYDGFTIFLARTPFTINWFAAQPDNPIVQVQLVLSPVTHWAQVFSTYHSDLVCVGYSTASSWIFAKGRFDRFLSTGRSRISSGFMDQRYRDRVVAAYEKYTHYGFDLDWVELPPPSALGAEASPKITVDTLPDPGKPLDEQLRELSKDSITFGRHLYNVYTGEQLKPYVETFCFNRCPVCQMMIMGHTICARCHGIEQARVKRVDEVLQQHKHLRFLVTGGRNGLGRKVREALQHAGCNVDWTQSSVEDSPSGESEATAMATGDPPPPVAGAAPIICDFRKCSDIGRLELKVASYDVLILSAAETLHHEPVAGTGVLEDTGVWFKTLDEHSDSEIADPIQINVVAQSRLIRAFMQGQYKEPRKPKMIIYVTSSEGAFIAKNPFHPITNATKAAMEQLVHTIKAHCGLLGIRLYMADPGWMYTKSAAGTRRGPIEMKWGAAQILEPVVDVLQGIAKPNGSLYTRLSRDSLASTTVARGEESLESCVKFRGEGEMCPIALTDNNVWATLSCGHQFGIECWLKVEEESQQCPMCRSHVEFYTIDRYRIDPS